MILPVIRTGLMNLRRDRAALALSFVLPIVFFSIFAGIFGSQRRQGTPKIRAIVADEDDSQTSRRLVRALEREEALRMVAAAEQEPPVPSWNAGNAEAAVRAGKASVAIVVPKGFGGSAASAFSGGGMKIQLLYDSADPIAPQVVSGLLQKTAMTAFPDALATPGIAYFEKMTGGLTPEQRKGLDSGMSEWRKELDAEQQTAAGKKNGSGQQTAFSGLVQVEMRDLLGEKKANPVVAFYAAALGVMFLLFSATGAGGALLDEAESGTLDRVLATRVNMTTLLLGKMGYQCLIGITQLVIMFTWGALVFKVELLSHLPGFLVMTVITALAASGFGLMLAAASRTRAQLAALSTIVILTMSSLGGSMFPRFLMPENIQKLGMITFNAWAIDGFTKIFWRDEPVVNLWPQVLVLAGATVVFFMVARRLARKWEVA